VPKQHEVVCSGQGSHAARDVGRRGPEVGHGLRPFVFPQFCRGSVSRAGENESVGIGRGPRVLFWFTDLWGSNTGPTCQLQRT
jgi:hypothetical protein